MRKEEKILKDKVGKVNPFTVPEGYFESFTEQMTELLPEMEARVIEMRAESLWHRLPIRKIAAVVGIGCILSGGMLWLSSQHTHEDSMHASMSKENEPVNSRVGEYGTFDQMADYTMMDSQAIYASLVAEN